MVFTGDGKLAGGLAVGGPGGAAEPGGSATDDVAAGWETDGWAAGECELDRWAAEECENA